MNDIKKSEKRVRCTVPTKGTRTCCPVGKVTNKLLTSLYDEKVDREETT